MQKIQKFAHFLRQKSIFYQNRRVRFSSFHTLCSEHDDKCSRKTRKKVIKGFLRNMWKNTEIANFLRQKSIFYQNRRVRFSVIHTKCLEHHHKCSCKTRQKVIRGFLRYYRKYAKNTKIRSFSETKVHILSKPARPVFQLSHIMFRT